MEICFRLNVFVVVFKLMWMDKIMFCCSSSKVDAQDVLAPPEEEVHETEVAVSLGIQLSLCLAQLFLGQMNVEGTQEIWQVLDWDFPRWYLTLMGALNGVEGVADRQSAWSAAILTSYAVAVRGPKSILLLTKLVLVEAVVAALALGIVWVAFAKHVLDEVLAKLLIWMLPAVVWASVPLGPSRHHMPRTVIFHEVFAKVCVWPVRAKVLPQALALWYLWILLAELGELITLLLTQCGIGGCQLQTHCHRAKQKEKRFHFGCLHGLDDNSFRTL